MLSKLKYPLILDGGLSNVLEDFGCDLNNELWVANLLNTNPEAIIKTHLAYLKAGAQIISTSSYQATIPGFMKLGFNEHESKALILKSVELAHIALQRYYEKYDPKHKPLIAASIGPYGAFLADGSEYRGHYTLSDKDLAEFHRKRINLLDESNCDLLAFETIPSIQEIKVLCEILKTIKTPSWVSLSCKDGSSINDGTSIKEAAALIKDEPNIFAIGINCTAPKYISSLVTALKSAVGNKKIIVYPNSGESYNAKSKTWVKNSNPIAFAEMTSEWIELGADIVGGCCRIGPTHIKNISNLSKNRFNS